MNEQKQLDEYDNFWVKWIDNNSNNHQKKSLELIKNGHNLVSITNFILLIEMNIATSQRMYNV